MSTIKFEKGKLYKTRDGKKVECVHTNMGGCTPFLFATDEEDFFSTNQNGSFYHDEDDSRYDIISEWPKERVVWVVYSLLPVDSVIFESYNNALRYLLDLPKHPTNSLTRVVIQDGHVDKE